MPFHNSSTGEGADRAQGSGLERSRASSVANFARVAVALAAENA
jgi:hypothetical protein